MKNIKKYIAGVIVIILLIAVGFNLKGTETVEASGVAGPSFLVASSSTFTLTTASTRLLGTTTPQGQSGARVTATVQPINCTVGSSGGAFLSLNGNISATANAGLLAFASSTLILGDHVNQAPNVRGPVNGIVGTGTCTVLVTEWRTQ
jgi:hypothetical protein